MKSTPLYILGAGGHAKVVVATAEAAGFEIAAIYDEDDGKRGKALLGHAITVPTPAAGDWPKDAAAIIAIGDNRVRQRLAAIHTLNWPAVVHPGAMVHPSVTIGPGTLVCAGVIIQPDAKIGAHAIINTGAIVEHDCRVGDYAHIGPAACLAGNVDIGEGAFVGAGTTVIPGIRVGAGAIVGAGAAIVTDIAPDAKVGGVPARPLK